MERLTEQLKHLWRTCFDDEESFIEHFFQAVYQEKYVRFLEENGTIYCALYRIPYIFSYYGTQVPATYIYAVGTLPEYRNRGAMKQLLQQTLQELQAEGNAFAFLIPAEDWLYNYYQRYGFQEAFYFGEACFQQENHVLPSSGTLYKASQQPQDDIFSWFDRQQQQRICSPLHSRQDWDFHYQDIREAGGDAFYLKNEQQEITALALAFPCRQEVIIKEFLYQDLQERDRLLQEIALHFQVRRLSYKAFPQTQATARRYGMACLLNPDLLIPAWQKSHPDILCPAEAIHRMNRQQQTSLLFNFPEKKGYLTLMMD